MHRLQTVVLITALTACFAVLDATAESQVHYVRDTGFTYGAWRSGVLGGGGYIQNVVPSATNPQRLYSYVDVGGLYRSDDGGERWRMLHGNLPARAGNYEVRGALVDPRDDAKLIIATGSMYAAKEGIYISNDAGESWERTLVVQFYGNGGNRSSGFILARHPSDPDIILAASVGDGVWRSSDNGRTWEKASGGDGVNASDIRFDRADPTQAWVCATGGKIKQQTYEAGFYRSTDGGANWTRVPGEAPSEILQDPGDPSLLYGIFGSQLIRRSNDGGMTWEDWSDGLSIKIEGGNKQSISETTYRALAAGPDFVLTANTRDSTFFRLDSGASAWQAIRYDAVEVGDWFGKGKGSWFFGAAMGSITVSPHDPDHWFFTDYFAIYQTKDAGRNWRLTISGIEVTVTHCLTQDPTNPDVIYLGQADVGPFVSRDGGQRFTRGKVVDTESDKDGGKNMKAIDLSPALPTRLYGVADQNYHVGWLANQVYISEDSGVNWRRTAMRGLPNMKGKGATTIAADLKDPDTVYLTVAGSIATEGDEPYKPNGGVYKSTDKGESWTWMGDGLPGGKYYFPFEIWAHGRQLAVGHDGEMIAISAQSNFIHYYDPAQQKWIRSPLKHAGKLWSVVADRLTPGRFFVGVRSDGVYRTDDGGRTWAKVYEGSAAYVATDSAVAGRVAAGTSDGVIVSFDGGTTWQHLDKQLPYRVDNIPAFAGDRVIVGSGGSGVFWLPLPEKPLQ